MVSAGILSPAFAAGPAAPQQAKSAVAAAAAGPVKVTSVEGITEYRLRNGMRVLLFPDASKPTPPEVRRPVSGNPVAGSALPTPNTVFLGRVQTATNAPGAESTGVNAMTPTWMTVPVNTTVTFTNPAGSLNTHCATQFFEGLFNFKLAPGQSATYTFDKAGEYFYNDCHSPRPTGKIVVN